MGSCQRAKPLPPVGRPTFLPGVCGILPPHSTTDRVINHILRPSCCAVPRVYCSFQRSLAREHRSAASNCSLAQRKEDARGRAEV